MIKKLTPPVCQLRKHPSTKLYEFKDLDAPCSTRTVYMFTVDHISYGQLLCGLEFYNAEGVLVAKAGQREESRMTLF